MRSSAFVGFVLGFLTLIAWSFSARSLVALWEGPDAFGPPFTVKYRAEWFWVVSHGASSAIVLALGPCLVLRRWSAHLAHRWLGKLYLGCAVVSAMTALPLASSAEGGALGRAGFFTLDALWLRAAWGAWVAARGKNFALHEQWVEVHCLLAWSAVLQRMGLVLAARMELDFSQIAGPLVWLSLFPGCWLGCRWGLWTKPV